MHALTAILTHFLTIRNLKPGSSQLPGDSSTDVYICEYYRRNHSYLISSSTITLPATNIFSTFRYNPGYAEVKRFLIEDQVRTLSQLNVTDLYLICMYFQ